LELSKLFHKLVVSVPSHFENLQERAPTLFVSGIQGPQGKDPQESRLIHTWRAGKDMTGVLVLRRDMADARQLFGQVAADRILELASVRGLDVSRQEREQLRERVVGQVAAGQSLQRDTAVRLLGQVVGTPAAERLSVSFGPVTDPGGPGQMGPPGSGGAPPEDDPWDFWVFRVSADFSGFSFFRYAKNNEAGALPPLMVRSFCCLSPQRAFYPNILGPERRAGCCWRCGPRTVPPARRRLSRATFFR